MIIIQRGLYSAESSRPKPTASGKRADGLRPINTQSFIARLLLSPPGVQRLGRTSLTECRERRRMERDYSLAPFLVLSHTDPLRGPTQPWDLGQADKIIPVFTVQEEKGTCQRL